MENKKTYSEDHVLSMFEEIKGQNKIVIEQYSDLVDKVGTISNQYSNLNEKVDLILEDIDILKSRTVDMKNMKAEKEITDNHEKRIVKLEKTSLAVA